MALVDSLKGSFASGELSPRMLARQDVDRYKNGAILIENFKVLPQGGLTRSEGTRYVASAKYPTRLCLLKPFEPSTLDAYVLEVGHQYIRFYKANARVESPPGTPVEVATPYQETQLRAIRTAQSNDVMLLVHPAVAPQRLSRLSDTSWDLRPIQFNPPPTYEAGNTFAVSLNLGALSGTGIPVLASGALWLGADVDRVIKSGVGRAILRSVSSSVDGIIDIIDPFTTAVLAANAWTLEGSPVAGLQPDKKSPVGAAVTLSMQALTPTGPNLVAHGSFDSGLTGWTNVSGRTLASGTHTGANNSANLIDSGANFTGAGVQPTNLVSNTTDGSSGLVGSVTPQTIIMAAPGLTGGAEHDFDTGDAYTITDTGAATANGGAALLTGGSAGVAWISQGIATLVGSTYQVTFQVLEATLSAQVGTSASASDVLTEASYGIGNHTLTFVAKSTTSYIQFKNNQNNTARVTAISAQLFTAQGFRPEDVGKYVNLHRGLVRLTSFVTSSQMQGEIVKEMDTDGLAPAGAWTLESPAWSDTLGWPNEVILYEGRLAFFGSPRFPQDIWQSAVNDLFNMAEGINPSDAIHLSLVDSGGNITLNQLRWAMPAENLLIGTTHGEYRLIGSGDDPITPATLPRNRIQSTFGSDTVKPLKVGSAILFVQRQGSKLREMAFDERTVTTFLARDITITSDHLLRQFRLLELAYQQEPLPLVYGVRSDGQLLGLTYDQSEQLSAWWRRTTQGSFESLATIPDPAANAHQVWVSVKRHINGADVRFIERFDTAAHMALLKPVTMLNELTQESEQISGWDGLTVDAAIVYSGAPTATITGLSHLEGMSVTIVGDGAVLPPQVVRNGQIPLGQTVKTAFVGLSYVPRGRTLPIDLPIRGVTQQGLRKRWAKLWARIETTACLVMQGERLPFRQQHMPMDQGVAPFSGDRQCPTPLGWDRRGMVSFEVPDPLPCTLIGIFGTLDSETQQ